MCSEVLLFLLVSDILTVHIAQAGPELREELPLTPWVSLCSEWLVSDSASFFLMRSHMAAHPCLVRLLTSSSHWGLQNRRFTESPPHEIHGNHISRPSYPGTLASLELRGPNTSSQGLLVSVSYPQDCEFPAPTFPYCQSPASSDCTCRPGTVWPATWWEGG